MIGLIAGHRQDRVGHHHGIRAGRFGRACDLGHVAGIWRELDPEWKRRGAAQMLGDERSRFRPHREGFAVFLDIRTGNIGFDRGDAGQ
jgi:hypothetical protein